MTTRRLSFCFAIALIAAAPRFGYAQQASGGLTEAQLHARAKAQDIPEIPFDSAPNLLKLPAGLYLGEGIGVATNSKGHIFVYTRSQLTRLFEFDQRGNFVREIGEGLYGFAFAYAVRVDPQDNIWAVDEGSNMIIKFNPEGRVVMLLGRRPEPPTLNLAPTPPPNAPEPVAEPYTFSRPTDVAWDAAGNIFVSDGYGNSRVAKYDKNGRFITSVGSKGSAPGQLTLPHTIAADAKGNVYVGDRSNSRIQVFDDDLKFKAIYDKVGAPWAVCVTPGPTNTCTAPIRTRIRVIRRSAQLQARYTRWSSTGQFWVNSVRRVSSSASSAPCMRSTAQARITYMAPRSRRGVFRRSRFIRTA